MNYQGSTYKDIDISITGLRPGEELLGDKTKTFPTHNEKIMEAKDVYLPFPTVYSKTRQLVTSAVRANSNKEMVRLLKDLVPEFISKNSEYEELDERDPELERVREFRRRRHCIMRLKLDF